VPDAEDVLRKRAAELRSPLEFVTRSSSHPTALFGLHQSRNAALAVAALRAANLNICEKAVVSGLATVQWPARFQLFDERTVIDGAHNAAGAQILAETWRAKFGDANAAVVFGVLRDKEAIEIFRPLAAIAHSLILPHFHGQRAMPPAELATLLHGVAQQPISIAASCAEAIHDARLSGRPVLITGSLHLAGEALASLERRPAAFEECDQ
jgi:dihydrofolate synthase/folylpolyglutamate synthase